MNPQYTINRILILILGVAISACSQVRFDGFGKANSPSPTSDVAATPPDTNTPIDPSILSAHNAGPFETTRNTPITINTSDILLAVTNNSGSTITISAFGTPANGSISDHSTYVIYTPGPNFVGQDAFQYTVTDGQGHKSSAQVIINVRPPADQPTYAHTAGTLYSVNADAQTVQHIADFRLNGTPHNITDIAITGGGAMYGVDTGTLFFINAQTGELSVVRQLGVDFGNVTGLAVLPDGKLVIGGTGLFTFDINTGAVGTLVPKSRGFQTDGDMIVLPDGNLYWTTNTELQPYPQYMIDQYHLPAGSMQNVAVNKLYRVNIRTGEVASVGAFPISKIWGLGYVNGRMIGFDGNGYMMDISTNDATISNRKQMGLGGWNGATTNPLLW